VSCCRTCLQHIQISIGTYIKENKDNNGAVELKNSLLPYFELAADFGPAVAEWF
jgi:hypothetical protein